MRNLKRPDKGFTLIELMIVVVVIGILARIAIPSYLDSIKKSRRSDAKSSLLQLAQFMERNYTLANRYDQNSAGATINTAALPFNVSPQTGTKYYDLTLSVGTAPSNTYTLTATPVNGTSQASDSCGTLSIDNTGLKSPTTSGCW